MTKFFECLRRITGMALNELDRVEILSQDNYIRARPWTTATSSAGPETSGTEIRNSIGAEHGFSAVRMTREGRTRTLLFDFGFPRRHGNQCRCPRCGFGRWGLSLHGRDHTGGLKRLVEKIGKKGLDLVLHPGAFKEDRYITRRGKDRFPRFPGRPWKPSGFTVATAIPIRS